MTNCFLLYTPFHAEYVRQIIGEHFTSDTNYIVNHYSAPFVAQPGEPIVKVTNLPAKPLERIAGVRRARKMVRALAASGGEVNIFIPHTLGILSNYAYHRLAPNYSNVSVNIYYEGVIVFYGYDHDYLENYKYYLSRWLVSAMAGIRYVIDKRLLDFYDRRISRIYTPFVGIDAPAGKVVETPLPSIRYVPEQDCCVILGLVLEKRYAGELPRIIAAIYDKVNELRLKKIYFKDHPLDPCELFYTMAKEAGIELDVIRDTAPVEKIIASYAPAWVFSSWSSGILNMKRMIPAGTNMYCFVTERITETPELKKLVNIFAAEGIKVQYV